MWRRVLIRVQLKHSILQKGSRTQGCHVQMRGRHTLYQLACMLAHGIWVKGSRACIFLVQEHCVLFHLGCGTKQTGLPLSSCLDRLGLDRKS